MKRLLSAILCGLVLFTSSMAYTEALSSQEQAGNLMKNLGLYKGYEDGSLRLKNNITRAEFATIAVKMLGMEKTAEAKKGTTGFTDVAGDFWGSGFINTATEQNLMSGYPDSSFRPQGNITYGETITVLVSLLGYKNDIPNGPWPDVYMAKAQELGITKGLNYKPDYVVSRGDVALLISNALSVPVK